jgi:CHAD domain-containing protein
MVAKSKITTLEDERASLARTETAYLKAHARAELLRGRALEADRAARVAEEKVHSLRNHAAGVRGILSAMEEKGAIGYTINHDGTIDMVKGA